MTEPVPKRRTRAGDADREQTLSILQDAYAEGRLSLDEMSERQDRALACRYVDELPALVEDLPGAQLLPGRDATPSAAQLPREAPFALAFMSGRTIALGPGQTSMSSFAWWGGNDIDLTAAMGPGVVVTLTLNAVMGGNSIVVPPGVRILDQSLAIMAGNDIQSAQGDGSNGTLVLKGFLWWAGNSVKLAQR